MLGLCSALLPIAAPPSVAQSGWTANLVAAYPASYNHATGGGAFNDGTSNEDIVESLQGGDFACSDIVTYLLRVEAGSGVDQVIEVDMSFLANTTGQNGGAHGDVTFVGMNRGPVQNGAGAGGKDSGFLDDEGSDVTHYEVALDPPGSTLFAGAAELLLTMTIDDLDGGEEVIVRIDTRLSCDPGSSPTGNLQATLDQVRLVENSDGPVQPPESLSAGGAQTIPFQKVGEASGAGEPLVNIEKTVMAFGGNCETDAVDSLEVATGDTVTYCYAISNLGSQNLFDISVTDDNATPLDADDFVVELSSGGLDLDGDGDLPDLEPSGEAFGEANVVINDVGNFTNTVIASGFDDKNAQYSDEASAAVTAQTPVGPTPTAVVPTATPTPTAVAPTATPTPTAVAPTATPTPTAVAPTATPTPTAVAPTATPTPTAVAPTPLPTSTPTVELDETPTRRPELVVTATDGTPPFNCVDGFDANCDGELGDFCPTELNLNVLGDVESCRTLLEQEQASSSTTAATESDETEASLAHTGSTPTLAVIGFALIVAGGNICAISRRRH